jgi:hypothetical protein
MRFVTWSAPPLSQAACGGLRSTPDCRPRRALLHLSYSYAPPCGPALLVTQCHKQTYAVQQTAASIRLLYRPSEPPLPSEPPTILGRRIVKVDPRPGSLSTVMSPPII